MLPPNDDDAVEDLVDLFPDDDGCYECGGEGFIVDDCDEDSCCCENPETDHGVIPCPACNPKGKK